MTIEEFMTITDSRTPKVEEMMALCDTLGIGVAIREGKPCLLPNRDNRAEAEAVAKLLRREPFRSAAFEFKFGKPEPKQEVEEQEGEVESIKVPVGAEIIVADSSGHYPSDKRFTGPHMWTWVGAERWYYVSTHPIP